MTRKYSIFLDLIRFISAIAVVLEHASHKMFSGDYLNAAFGYGHDAVIVFFVLSGFVIAYITDVKESNVWDYYISRLARLYSVVFPALIFTVVLDYLGQLINPSMYIGKFQGSDPFYRFFMNLFFMNEVWFLSVRPFSNGPFWSLSYEFWYYVIFSCYFFIQGKKKWIILLGLLVFVGPKILIHLPIWVSGTVLYYLSKNYVIGKRTAYLSCIFSITVYAVIKYFNLKQSIPFFESLVWSKWFLYDYLIGILFLFFLLGAKAIVEFNKVGWIMVVPPVEKMIRKCANLTFSIYLFHFPLLLFWTVALRIDTSDVIQVFEMLLIVFISIVLLSFISEHKKNDWKLLFTRILN